MKRSSLVNAYKRAAPLLERAAAQWKVTSSVPQESGANQHLPRNILLLRHGESLGNVDENLFTIMPDWKIPLSDKGRAQARQAGHRIQAIAKGSPLVVYVSPYTRTKETLDEVKNVIKSPVLFTREEPR